MPAKVYFPTVKIPRPNHMGGGEWQLEGLRPITVLFGKNGSGKSLLLREWRDSDFTSAHYIVPERTGELGFNASLLQTEIDARERRGQSTGNFQNQYRQHIIARIQAFLTSRGVSPEVQSPDKLKKVDELILALLPDFMFELAKGTPFYKLRRAENQQEVGDVNQLSSGEAQVFTLGLDILTMAGIWEVDKLPTRLMLVDEPDPHIHPDLQTRFADFLVQVAKQYDLQVVVATHSTTLLSALGHYGDSNCGIIYLDEGWS